MLKRHAFVFTRTKPWMTVDASIGSLTVPELCMMCDVRLIYLGNNKFGEIKCKPEVLSPLPKPKPSMEKQNTHTLVSPSEELVVRILDETKSSCTLVNLPRSPETEKIELSKQDMIMKFEGEPNDATLPVETSCVNIVNESQLIPQMTPTSSPVTKSSNTTLPNTVQTTVCASPATNVAKLEVSRDTESPTEQPDADARVIAVDNNQHDKPTVNTGNNGEPSTPGISETEPIEQPTLSQNTTNKDPVNHEQDVPITNHATPIRMCTVQLEILTEADIVKHVHVHRELKSKAVPLTKPGERQWKQWKQYTSQDPVPKQSCQGQTDSREEQVITLPMYTRMMKVTVEAVPWLKENVN